MTEVDWLETMRLWEHWVLRYLEVPETDDQLAKVPLSLAVEMKLDYDKLDDEYSTVITCEYSKALYEQGHVMNFILVLTILGEPYLTLRNHLIKLQFEYAVSHYSDLKKWKNATWIKCLLEGQVDYRCLLPLMTLWSYADLTSLEVRNYQYIVPTFLLLGDYNSKPTDLLEARIAHNAMILSTCHLGDNTWYENVCDVSRLRDGIFNFVKVANRFFYLPERQVTVNGRTIYVRYDKKHDSDQCIKRAGDWLSFGAYITLLSKYARYSLPLGNVSEPIKQEMCAKLGIVQNQLFKYNPEGNGNGRKESDGTVNLQEGHSSDR